MKKDLRYIDDAADDEVTDTASSAVSVRKELRWEGGSWRLYTVIEDM